MPGQQQAEGAQQGTEWTSLFWRMALIFLLFNYLIPSLTSTPRVPTDVQESSSDATVVASPAGTYSCLYSPGDALVGFLSVTIIDSLLIPSC